MKIYRYEDFENEKTYSFGNPSIYFAPHKKGFESWSIEWTWKGKHYCNFRHIEWADSKESYYGFAVRFGHWFIHAQTSPRAQEANLRYWLAHACR